jgi:hypothetical protein
MRLTGILIVAVLAFIGAPYGAAWDQTKDQTGVGAASEQLEPLDPPVATEYTRATQDWDALAASFAAHRPIPESERNAFVRAVINAQPESATEDWTVCSAGFARLADDGSLALIASMDVNGRSFCNYLFVITRTGSRVMAQGAYVWMVDDVHDVLVDLKKDGKLELAVPTAASEYEGYRCMATWTRILTLERGKLVDRSADFKPFYRARLNLILKELPAARVRDQSDGDGGPACLEMEADRIRRFLGISQDSGKAAAIRWLRSDDETLRSKGMTVLTDIGDPQSIEIAQQTALDWIHSKDRPARGDGEMWLMFHGDRQATAIYQKLALSWVQSGDKNLRDEGLQSLVEIGKKLSLDQGAIELLRKVAQDPDENIAGQARMALDEAGVLRH